MLFCVFLFWGISELSKIESIDRKEIRFDGDHEELSRNYINSYASKSDLEKVTIGNGITGIASYAFSEFKQLHTVLLSYSCSTLGSYAFQYCENLKNLVLQEGLKTIKDRCFFISGLVNITFPSSYTETPPSFAFYGCSNLENIYVAPNSTVYTSSEDHSMLIRDKSIAVLGNGKPSTIKIPSHIVEIAPYFMNGRSRISNVDFTEAKSLRRIGSAAFRYTSIQRVTFPSGLVSITNMFDGQSSIAYAFFPSTLENIGDFFSVVPKEVEVEDGCTAVKVDPNGIIYDKTGTSMIYLPSGTSEVIIELGVSSVLGASIRDTSSVTKVTVVPNHPNYSSYDNALYSADNSTLYVVGGGVKSLEIHADCQTIDSGAFLETAIESVDMSKCKNLTKLLSSAFRNCRKISAIRLPSTLTEIGDYCFSGSSVTSITMSPLLTSIGAEAFRNSGLHSIDLRECLHLKSILTDTFLNSRISEVLLPQGLKQVFVRAFSECSNLKRIELPSGITSIASNCFERCSSLSEVVFLGDCINTIPISCFSNCNLSSISLPSSVREIQTEAFVNNTFMTEISFGENSHLRTIQVDAFAFCNSLSSITLGAEFEMLSLGALSQMESLTEIIVEPGNKNFSARSGVLYSWDGRVLISFPGGIPKFTIDSDVNKIASRAFFGCHKLVSLEFAGDSSLETIGSYTFYGCSNLVSLTIPPSVSTINGMAFGGCTSLRNVTFAGKSRMGEVTAGVFEGCKHLKYVVFGRESQLRSVSANAFYGLTSLTDFVAPPSLHAIGEKAFYGCEGITKFDFTNITTIGESAFRNTRLKNIVLGVDIEGVGSDAFRGCELLQAVSYCGVSKELLEKADALIDYKGPIFVSTLYQAEVMFGHKVTVKFDGDCLEPTRGFTVGDGTGSRMVGIALGALTDPVSEEESIRSYDDLEVVVEGG